MGSVQKKTRGKASKGSKVAKSKHHKRERKHRSKDGKRRDGKGKVKRSHHGTKGSKDPNKKPRDPNKKKKRVSKSKKPSTDPVSPHAVILKKEKKKEDKKKDEKPKKEVEKVKEKKAKVEEKEKKKTPPKDQKDPKVEKKKSEKIELEVTQITDDSGKKKEEKKVEKKKEEEDDKEEEKTAKVEEVKEEKKKEKKEKKEPLPPGAEPNTPSKTPDKKELYKILDETPDTKSSGEAAKTPQAVVVEKKKSGSGSRKKKEKEEEKEEKSPEVKTPDQVGPPLVATDEEVEKINEEKEKMEKSKSLKDTQSNKSQEEKSPPKATIAAGSTEKPAEKKEDKEEKEDLPMESPPVSEKSDKIPKNMRSDLEVPLIEEGFVANHGDTQKLIGMKKVDIDLIGRTGMYMERGGMAPDKKQAFDWIAYNRHDLTNKQADFSQSLAVALGNVGIGKHLAMRTLVYLKSHGQMTPAELDLVLKEVHKCPAATVTFSQITDFLRKHAETYRSMVPLVPVTVPVPAPVKAPVAPKKGLIPQKKKKPVTFK